jgi:hypothetical protein
MSFLRIAATFSSNFCNFKYENLISVVIIYGGNNGDDACIACNVIRNPLKLHQF